CVSGGFGRWLFLPMNGLLGPTTAPASAGSGGSAAPGARGQRLVAPDVCMLFGGSGTALGQQGRKIEVAVLLEHRARGSRALGGGRIMVLQRGHRGAGAAAVSTTENGDHKIAWAHRPLLRLI